MKLLWTIFIKRSLVEMFSSCKSTAMHTSIMDGGNIGLKLAHLRREGELYNYNKKIISLSHFG